MSIRTVFIVVFIQILNITHLQVYGQAISSAELKLMTVLNSESAFVPEDLQQTKSIVVLSIDDGSTTRGDWKVLADEAHFYIKRLSIDAVLYFYIDDLIAGYDIQRSIMEQMNSREIKNIFLLSRDKIAGRDQYIGVLTQFNQQPDFISNNQPAWKSQTSDLEILFRNLARTIDNKDLTKENLLIIDSPEYFHGVDIIRGKRFETFNTDLRIDRLAVPGYLDLPVPENPNTGTGNEMAAIIHSENAKNTERNAQLQQLMSNYPYEFEIVPYEYDEKKLLTRGFQFVLMNVKSSGRDVRRLLGYPASEDINEVVSFQTSPEGNVTQKSMPLDGTIIKYYIKHINSGDIYLGQQWDGDENWTLAFSNHLNALINALKR